MHHLVHLELRLPLAQRDDVHAERLLQVQLSTHFGVSITVPSNAAVQ